MGRGAKRIIKCPRSITFTTEEDDYKILLKIARRRQISLSALLRQIITAFIANELLNDGDRKKGEV